MKRLLLRLLPARAAAQITVIVIGSLVLANAVTIAVLLVLLPPELKRVPNLPYVTELVAISRTIEAAPTPAAKATIIDAALVSHPRLTRLPPDAQPSLRDPSWPDRQMLDNLKDQFGSTVQVLMLDSLPGQGGPPPFALRFADGSGLAMAPEPRTPPPRGQAFIFYLAVMIALLASLVGLLSLWAARAVASPLSRLAEAVDRFDPDRDDIAAPEQGPIEVKRLASAFGGMAARIRRLVDDRTRMLAAVSHDLRTPITRLRLRADEIADDKQRRAIVADLVLMERMVGGALSYLRDGRASGSIVATDVPALLQTICDDFADLGHIVVYEGPIRASALCDADQMMRAVTNLVDNAIKFGGSVLVRLDDSDSAVIAVDVEDDGPGIPPDEREKVFAPFYRSDLARTLKQGSGFGLGLSIVRAIAEAHRGELTLADRDGGGLRARISWPRRLVAERGRP
ncbi:ATP-binding protein [Bosea sp. (in: a-proteobacteria)]|uniref:ATP-binding protein n=1 Tax=Bosea sp. (in: a-proteobacteria) TaxID=1871050 RepID=UPI002735A7A5|nr:ATP-binding protein [Bosea sp. (in: a-proteobacteria)]MDP3408324.1 ATP-binding protein [Bosea sp. (in: a-proteobacteria)]